MALLSAAPPNERHKPYNYEFTTRALADAEVYTVADLDKFIYVSDERAFYRIADLGGATYGLQRFRPGARPMLSMTGPSPLPTNLVVPSGGTFDCPTWAIKIDDRAGVTVLGTNEYMEVAGELLDQPGRTVRLFAAFSLDIRDKTGSGGTVEWQLDAITGTGLGTLGEVIIESTSFFGSVTSSGVMRFGSGELFDLPGDFAPLEFGFRFSTDGANRTFDVLSHETQFFEVDNF